MSYYPQPHHAPMRSPRAREIVKSVRAGFGNRVLFDDIRQAYRVISEARDVLTLAEADRNRDDARFLLAYLEQHGEVANV